MDSEAAAITAAGDAAVLEYTSGAAELAAAREVVLKAMLEPQNSLHYLRPGRIVRVNEGARACKALRRWWA